MQACATCGRQNPDDSRFCNGCGSALVVAVRREERKVVTVVFADLVGFTPRAERMDPEDVRALLTPYWQRLREELERFGGTVEKFIGDAVMALFGAPVAHEDDPERAVRAAIAICDWARETSDLQVRIAVNTGEALILLDANPSEGEGMVAGDVVNTAARLQSAAPANGVLVGEATYRATRHAIDYAPHEPVLAKGKTDPLRVYEAVGARSRVTVEAVSSAPLVGRADEIELLVGALHRVRRDRQPQLVTVGGVPGIGKSRLVAELYALVEADTEFITWRRGRSLSYGEGVSLWALGEIAKAELGSLESDTQEETAAKLRESLAGLVADEGEREWLERRLAPLVGLPAEAAERGERFGAWRRWIELLADRDPLVLVFEDLHWGDDDLLDFVDELAEWVSDIPLLVVCTTRPELYERRPGWAGGKRNALTISLGPLSDADTARIVGATLERALLPAEAQAALLERAAGNPLYAEQYARMVSEGAQPIDLPETVQGIIAARLDLLAPDEKALLQDAAVVGRAFWPGALGANEDLLRSLVRKEFIRRERRSSIAGEQEYTFAHALVRDVAYAQIPRIARAKKHEAAAAWIETMPQDRAVDRAELRAYHLAAALELATAAGAGDDGLRRRARDAFKDAGDRALGLNGMQAAARHFAAALELTGDREPERPFILFGLGRAQAGDEPILALATLPQATEGLIAAGDLERASLAEMYAAHAAWYSGLRDQADAHAERAVALLANEPPSEAKAEAASQRARLLMLRGEDTPAIEQASAALEIARAIGSERLSASALITRGTALGLDGQADLERGLEIADREHDAYQLGRVLNNLAENAVARGDLAAVFPLMARYRREAEQMGARSFLTWNSAQEMGVRLLAGDWDRALELGTEVLAEIDAGNPTFLEAEVRRERATIRAARGDTAGAADDLERALVRARESKDPQILVPALATQAELHVAVGRLEEADSVLTDALEICASLEHLLYTYALALALPVLDAGVVESFIDVFAAEAADVWTKATLIAWSGDLRAAADRFASHGAPGPEAELRLRAAARLRAAGENPAADVELRRAIAFFRQVGATGRIRQAEALLAATA